MSLDNRESNSKPIYSADTFLSVILDANSFSRGRLKLADLRLLEDLIELGVRVSIPEPVLHELISHSVDKFSEVELFLDEILRDSDEPARPYLAYNLLAARLKSIGVHIAAPDHTHYRAALVAQVYGVSPTIRKHDVKTGAVDYIFYNMAVDMHRQSPSMAAVTGDAEIRKKLSDSKIPTFSNLREVRRAAMSAIKRVSWDELNSELSALLDETLWNVGVREHYRSIEVVRVAGITDAFIANENEWIIYGILHTVEGDAISNLEDSTGLQNAGLQLYPSDREMVAKFNCRARTFRDVRTGSFQDFLGYAFPYSNLPASEYLEAELSCIPAIVRPTVNIGNRIGNPTSTDVITADIKDGIVEFAVQGRPISKVEWHDFERRLMDEHDDTSVSWTEKFVDLTFTIDGNSFIPAWRGGLASLLIDAMSSEPLERYTELHTYSSRQVRNAL